MRVSTLLVLTVALLAPSMAAARAPVRSAVVIAQRWEELSPEQQDRARRNYQRYQSLPPEKRKDVDRRYRKWKALPNADKDRYREKYRDYRGRGLVEDDD